MDNIAEVKAADYDMLANGGLDDIRLAQHKSVNVRMRHTPRTCNNIAHGLAAIAFEDNLACTWLDNPTLYSQSSSDDQVHS